MKAIRIFLVDDEARVRAATMDYLKDFDDFDVVDSASGGTEALAKFQSVAPDVILLDISMPGMDGFETARRMLQIDPVVKIIMVSALSTAEYQAASRRIGAVDFVSKDELIDHLVPTIRRAMGGGV